MRSTENITYRPMNHGEEDTVSTLIRMSFMEHVASHYTREGIDEVLRLSEANSIRARNEAGNVFVVCVHSGRLVGMMEFRRPAHIGLLFVDPGYTGTGIGKGFIEEARKCAASISDVVTVNASPNSVTFYECCGFIQKGGKREAGGIIYFPMELRM